MLFFHIFRTNNRMLNKGNADLRLFSHENSIYSVFSKILRKNWNLQCYPVSLNYPTFTQSDFIFHFIFQFAAILHNCQS